MNRFYAKYVLAVKKFSAFYYQIAAMRALIPDTEDRKISIRIIDFGLMVVGKVVDKVEATTEGLVEDPQEDVRTKVFCHRGIIGIQSSLNSPGLINDPSQPNQLGFVMDAKEVAVSKEAMGLLKKVRKGRDGLGEIDVFQSDQGPVFGWLGGPYKMLNPEDEECYGSRDYDPSLLEDVCMFIPNDPPDDFVKEVDELRNAGKTVSDLD
jgi:hypothetical protein